MADLDIYTKINKGDMITLSDPQTEVVMDGPGEFEVKEKRVYTHELFKIYAYLLHAEKDEDDVFLMVKVVEEDYDFRLYYLDHGGTQEELIDEGWGHWSEDGDSFAAEFTVEIPTGETEDSFEEITFKEKDFGPFYKTILNRYTTPGEDSEELVASIAEYETQEDIDNQEAFIEWTGEYNGGWVEVYYGSRIHNSQIEVYTK